MTAMLMCAHRVKGKRYFSPPRCLERSKISRSSPSSAQYLSTSVGRVPPTSTSYRSLNMSSKRLRWSICLNVCRRPPLPSSCLAITRTRWTISRSTYFSKGSRPSPSMDQNVCYLISRERAIRMLIVVLAQEERQYAIKSFKSGAKDVMVASGVASKGLDFNDIQHVIIFSMPKEIEDYVHQIGRTGRSGKTGIATTFVNMNTPEQTLLDLKYLLMEAGQKCVPFGRCLVRIKHLTVLQSPALLANHRGSTGSSRRLSQRVSSLWRWVSAFSCPKGCRLMMPYFRSGTRHLQLSKARGYSAEADGFPPNFGRQGRVLSACVPFIRVTPFTVHVSVMSIVVASI
jgi:superfamily II DNA/RNA helicase